MNPELLPEFPDANVVEEGLLQALIQQGFHVETIQFIGEKGSGHQSTAYSVLIDGRHHILKVYRSPKAYSREIIHLRERIPQDRLVFAWPASVNSLRYDIVIIEVPDGREMHDVNLNPTIAERLASSFYDLHQIESESYTSPDALIVRLQEKRVLVVAHAAFYDGGAPHELIDGIDRAIEYARKNASTLRVRARQCHGDPSWANVIVADHDVYLIDWENSKFDDYCEDLAQFRILADFRPEGEPKSFWTEKRDINHLEEFMDIVLAYYEKHLPDPTRLGRYGFYGLYFAAVLFGDNYFWRRGTEEAYHFAESGLALFNRFCV